MIEMSLCPNFQPFDLKVFFPTIAMFRSVPVTAELQGLATIDGKTGELKMTIDYTSFVEVYTIYSTFLFSKMTMVMVHNEASFKSFRTV